VTCFVLGDCAIRRVRVQRFSLGRRREFRCVRQGRQRNYAVSEFKFGAFFETGNLALLHIHVKCEFSLSHLAVLTQLIERHAFENGVGAPFFPRTQLALLISSSAMLSVVGRQSKAFDHFGSPLKTTIGHPHRRLSRMFHVPALQVRRIE
jgi:hypothetical protein